MGVVPAKVRIKVSGYVLAACILLALLPETGLSTSALSIIYAVILSLGGYLVWCFWPTWSWGARPVSVPGDAGSYQFTFDDGPTPGLTEALLDMLAIYRIQASFFVLVDKAEKHPKIIRRIVSEGHTLGLHGQDHRKPFFSSRNAIKRHLGPALAKLQEIAGSPVTLYRPSHGWKTLSLIQAVNDLNLRFCYWDFGVWDTDNPPLNTLLERLRYASRQLKSSRPTSILLHDGRGDAQMSPPHAEVLLKALSEFLHERHHQT